MRRSEVVIPGEIQMIHGKYKTILERMSRR
jgi:hypothetical protein